MNMTRRIKAVEMGYCRRCCAKTIMDRVSNKEIRHRINVENTSRNSIEKKKTANMIWICNAMTDGRSSKRILEWTPKRIRRRDRQQKGGKRKFIQL